MSLKYRVNKLEAANTETSLRIVTWLLDENGEAMSAGIGGTGLTVEREADESSEDFRRRVFAVQALGKPVEDMNRDERKRAFEMAEEHLLRDARGETLNIQIPPQPKTN